MSERESGADKRASQRRRESVHDLLPMERFEFHRTPNPNSGTNLMLFADPLLWAFRLGCQWCIVIAFRAACAHDGCSLKSGEILMRRLLLVSAAGIAISALVGLAQKASTDGPYRIVKMVKVGGAGTFDTACADIDGRRLYIPRKNPGRITVFNLDTLEPTGEIPNAAANGVVIDTRSGHGFASSKPVVMWDTKTMKTIKTIDVQGGPDAILFDPFNERVYIFSHVAPNATVINAVDGSVLGTIDLGGMPEQAVTDGKGHVYVDIRDKGNVTVIDAETLTVAAHYDLGGRGGRCSGLAIDVENHVLFAACREPQTMVMLNASDGKVIDALPIGSGVDSAIFNPGTMETFSAQVDGTLTVVKENSPTSFVVEQTVQTKESAKQMVWDRNTNRILLIAADYDPPPSPIPAGAPAGRGAMVPDSFSILVVSK
jgi:DNA-binding beta-propeller fold protein YncE